MYIVFEGIVGTGKTTQSKRVFEYLKKKFPDKEIIWTREPGGTEIAEAIRKVVQGTEFNEDMDYICEQYLYAASRAQALRKVVRPVLDKGGIVVSDRNYITSLANQGYGRDLGIKQSLLINKVAIQGFIPDIVIQLRLSPKVCLSRLKDKNEDKFERLGLDFHTKLAKGYDKASKMKGICKKWIKVDASGDSDEVFEKIIKKLNPLL